MLRWGHVENKSAGQILMYPAKYIWADNGHQIVSFSQLFTNMKSFLITSKLQNTFSCVQFDDVATQHHLSSADYLKPHQRASEKLFVESLCLKKPLANVANRHLHKSDLCERDREKKFHFMQQTTVNLTKHEHICHALLTRQGKEN